MFVSRINMKCVGNEVRCNLVYIAGSFVIVSALLRGRGHAAVVMVMLGTTTGQTTLHALNQKHCMSSFLAKSVLASHHWQQCLSHRNGV